MLNLQALLQRVRGALVLLFLFAQSALHATTVTFTTAGGTTWTAPAGVTAITVEVWGGGGAGGGQNMNSDGGGGGGGGAYSKVLNLAVTPGNTYSLSVGSGGTPTAGGAGGAGGDSWFMNTATVMAKGGSGGSPSTGTPPAGGLGGDAAAGVGGVKFSGGNGGAGLDSNTGLGAPGGSSAGTAANGTSGPSPWSTVTAGAAPVGGSIGGNGGGSGSNGSAPASGSGGGGGGSGEGGSRLGGAGAAGKVVITYLAVTTNAASTLGPTTATLNGVVSSDNAAVNVSFEYGTTTAYGSTVSATQSPVAANTSSAAVSASISGLSTSTTYHYRVKGSSINGAADGADRTFTTLPPLSKVASAASASVNDVVTFTITLANSTGAAYTNKTVTDTLPAGMSYGSHVASTGTVTVVGSTITWSIPSIPSGESATLTLAVSLTQQGTLTNTATSSGFPNATASVLVLANAVTHFRMDEPVGAWTGAAGEVLDSGTTGLHGRRITTTSPTTTNEIAPSPTIASQFTSVVGGFCNAARFDGNAVVQVASSAAFSYTTTLSASAWIYPTAYSTDLSSILSNDVNYEFHLDSNGKLYWWWNASSLTSAATIPLNQWTHVAITFDSANGRQRIYINGAQDANTNNWTGTLQNNPCNFYVGGDVATGSCALIPGRNFRGNIDEVKLYSKELSAAEVQADMTLGRSCSGTYDHIQIEHDGVASICTPEAVTVKACLNASCSTLYTGAVTVQLSPSGWVGGNTFSFSGGIGSRQLSNGTPGNVTLGTVSASPLPASATRCFVGSGETCSMNFANASCTFDAVESGAAPQTRLFTKLASTAFNVDVLALSSSSVINTGYTGSVDVDLVDASSAACPTGTGLNSATTISFAGADAGRKPVSFTYGNAARNVRVRMRVGASAPACSTDNFAIRPQQFTVTAPTLNNTGLIGTPSDVAGNAFTLNAAAGVASGYSGTTPVLVTSKIQDHAGAAIANGTFSGAFGAGDGTKAQGTAFKYLDVGNIQFSADALVDGSFTSVDQTTDCISGSTSNTLSGGKYGCNIGSAQSSRMGRWYPSHYSFTGTLTPFCSAGGFTYMDQDALGVAVAIKAHAALATPASATDPVVSRYTTGYSNLASVTLSGDNAGSAVAITRLTSPPFPTMPNTSLWSAGLFAVNDTYAFSKLANPDGPYDSFKIKAAISDPDGRSFIGSSAETGTTRVRYGRMRMQNAYGSELLRLQVPLEAQYWDGNFFVTNTLDNCTSLTLSSVAMSGYTGNLSACKTQISPTASQTLVNGKLVTVPPAVPGPLLELSKPGLGNSGSVLLTLNLSAAASGNTCVSSTQSAATAANRPWFGNNPTARATFGVYTSPLIYLRENY